MSWVVRVRAALVGAVAMVVLVLAAVPQQSWAADGSWQREELRLHFEMGRLAVLLGDRTVEEADSDLARTAEAMVEQGYSADRIADTWAQHRIEMARFLAQIEWRIRKEAVWPDDQVPPEEHAAQAREALQQLRIDDNAIRYEGGDLLETEIAAEALYRLTDGVLDFPAEQSVFFGRDERVDALIAGLPGAQAGAAPKKTGQQAAAAAPKSAKKRAAETGEDPLAVLAWIIAGMVNGREDTDTSPCDGFAGMWQSDAGAVLLDADGFGVYDGGASVIDGKVKGRQLSGAFTQKDTTGKVSITLAKDGRSFAGKWSSGPDGGPFNGTCIAGGGDPAFVGGMVAEAIGAAFADAARAEAEAAMQRIGGADAAPVDQGAVDQGAVDQAALDEEAQRKEAEEAMKRLGGNDADQAAAVDLPCSGFAGRWETNYGAMQLQEDANDASVLVATYAEANELRGNVNGNTLTGTFTEPGWGHGLFTFTLSDDGRTFSGNWTNADGSGGEPWTGTCVPPAAG